MYYDSGYTDVEYFENDLGVISLTIVVNEPIVTDSPYYNAGYIDVEYFEGDDTAVIDSLLITAMLNEHFVVINSTYLADSLLIAVISNEPTVIIDSITQPSYYDIDYIDVLYFEDDVVNIIYAPLQSLDILLLTPNIHETILPDSLLTTLSLIEPLF